jgi:DNA-binding XRE family transcriptional regulator
MAKVTSDVMRWVDDQLAADPKLRERVDANLAALRIEQELIALREARGLSQAQVAKLLGVSQPAVAKIESGSENLTLRTLVKMVTALGGMLSIRVTQPTRAKVVGIRTRSTLARTGVAR